MKVNVLLFLSKVGVSAIALIHNLILQLFFVMVFELNQTISIWELLTIGTTQVSTNNPIDSVLPYNSLIGANNEETRLTQTYGRLSNLS